MQNQYTNVMDGVWQCNDCGAHADTKENVVHFKTCQPGESAKWEKFYSEEQDDNAVS
jgi:hypothetical protein